MTLPAPPLNLFADLPQDASAGEQFDLLWRQPGLRIERIVSTGQASAPDFWYEQEEAEWVVLLSGAALLRFADEAGARPLQPGDWLYIAPRRRHRVDSTAADVASVWLAVHFATD